MSGNLRCARLEPTEDLELNVHLGLLARSCCEVLPGLRIGDAALERFACVPVHEAAVHAPGKALRVARLGQLHRTRIPDLGRLVCVKACLHQRALAADVGTRARDVQDRGHAPGKRATQVGIAGCNRRRCSQAGVRQEDRVVQVIAPKGSPDVRVQINQSRSHPVVANVDDLVTGGDLQLTLTPESFDFPSAYKHDSVVDDALALLCTSHYLGREDRELRCGGDARCAQRRLVANRL